MTTKRPVRRSILCLAAALALAGGAAVPAAAAPNDPGYANQWALPVIGAPEAWAGGMGAGITIAIVDTGVDLNHEDLAAKIVAGRDFVGSDPPRDEHGHGTHVAGIAAAVTNNGRGVAGTAPEARIMPVRVLDDEGRGNASGVAAGIRWATDNGAQVINLSLATVGRQVFESTAFADALRYAWSRGSIPVVAAGNDFVLSSGYSDHPAIVVSATDRQDRKPEYSSGVGQAQWGMAAPGGAGMLAPASEKILSTWWQPGESNLYAYQSGTSMAAPHVAGAAAVLRGMGVDQQRTVQLLLETAEDIGPQGTDSTFGHGRLDLAAAVDRARAELGGPAPAPQAAPEPAPPAQTRSSGAVPTPMPAPAEGGDPTPASEAEPETPEGDPRHDEPTPASGPAAAPDPEERGNTTRNVLAGVALLMLGGGAWLTHLVNRRGP